MKSIRSVWIITGLVIALCLAGGNAALAQSDLSQITGFVMDATDAVVPGATVTVTNEETSFERRVETNQNGRYVATPLPSGFYTIVVEAEGFNRTVITQNKLDANLPLAVDVTIEVGAVTETVEVIASAAVLQTETATVGRVVENEQIRQMILNGRNPVLLALLKPGVRTGRSMGAFQFGRTSGGYSMNGSRSQDNLITMDGAIATRTRANGTQIGAADVDTIQEIQILTANFKAEYGRSGGGQIRMVTRSGTQDFHGTAYEFFRNNELDANTWDRNRAGLGREAFKFNQFGYNFSGPIPGKFNPDKNKLFFLFAQEYNRFRREETSIITVPSLAHKRGDFSGLLDPGNPFFGQRREVLDPDTGSPFANNMIPSSRLSPNGVGLMTGYPVPSPGFQQGTNNFIQTLPVPDNQRKTTISIDFNPTQKHSIRYRHQLLERELGRPFRSGTDRVPLIIELPDRTITVNHIWTISPTTVNEFLFGFSKDRVGLIVGTDEHGCPSCRNLFVRDLYGINYPYLFDDPKEIQNKIPTVEIDNFQRLDGGPYPAATQGPVWQFENNLTHIVGNHTLKVGARYAYQGQDDFDQINVTGVPGGTNNQNGRFVFTDGTPNGTGLGLGNAALGLFSTYAEIGTRALTVYRAHEFDWYFQDSWAVTPKLKMELGVRHTLMTPYYFAKQNNMSIFDANRYDPSRAVVQDPATGNILSGPGGAPLTPIDRFNGVLFPGSGFPGSALDEHTFRPGQVNVAIAQTGEFDSLFSGNDIFPQRHLFNFQPRLGLAYRLNDKTVLRAGAGRFYARPGVADNIFLGGNPPFQPTASVANGSADNPGGVGTTAFPGFFQTIDPVYKIPSTWNWNAAIQRELGFSTIVEVSYVGRTAVHLERTIEFNALPLGTRTNPANDGLSTNFLRPYKGFAFINLGENAARSEYHGLQMEATRRFTGGLSFGVAYTLSKSEDNASHRRRQPWNPFDDRGYWGPSEFDSRHVTVMNFIWDVPFLQNSNSLAGKVLGGWTLSGVIQFQTGDPFTVGRGNDRAGIGSGGAFQPWEVSGDPVLSRGARRFSNSPADSNFAFRTTGSDGGPLFTEPALGTFSRTQTRTLYYQPGFQNFNLGVFKRFAINERHNVTLRGEFFNAANHANWRDFNTNPTSGAFGKVTRKVTERQVQVSLRYSF